MPMTMNDIVISTLTTPNRSAAAAAKKMGMNAAEFEIVKKVA
jgi:hypothetical protein